MTTWLHIGLHKTGSTTLQEEFFPRLRGLVYFGGKGTRLPPPAKEDMRRLIVALKAAGHRPDVVAGIIAFFRGRADAWNPQCLSSLISEEGFSGTWPDSPFNRITVLPAVLRRILDGDARVVVVVREPLALLVSMYEQRMARLEMTYVRKVYGFDGIPTFDKFVALEHARLQQGAHDTVFGGTLRFDRVIGAYADVFGDDRVHVLPFEAMASEPEQYCRAWCRLLGIPEQIVPLHRRNASGPGRRREILARFGIEPTSPRGMAFEAQFADLPARLRDDPLLCSYAAQHCEPVRARAAATYAALTGDCPSAT